LIESFELIQIS